MGTCQMGKIDVIGKYTFLRFVKTGLSDGINIEVISGLTMEDKIKAGKKEDIKKKKDESEDS